MQPARGSRGRSVRQNFRGKQFLKKDNGPSGIRVVTHREEGSGQHFLHNSRKVKIREGKPVRITVAWHCGIFRWKAVKWELSAMMVPICVFEKSFVVIQWTFDGHSLSFMVIHCFNVAKQMTTE